MTNEEKNFLKRLAILIRGETVNNITAFGWACFAAAFCAGFGAGCFMMLETAVSIATK